MPTSKPNILLILADDMGCGDLGCYGNPDARTPNLDALAREGLRLTQGYSGSPVCAPARAALMTGRYPHRTGAIDTLEGRGLDRLATREVTLADVLNEAGYTTGLVGKWHLGALDAKYHPNARGFDEFVGFRGGWQDYWQWRLFCSDSVRKADGRYLTDVFTEEAIGFIERHSEEPWFLHVTYNSPHFPLQVPDEDAQPFRDLGKFTEGVSLIHGMNRRMDRGIGSILSKIDELGLAENTLVIFASDNGPQFGGEGDMNTDRFNCGLNGWKGLTYEGGIRVPMMVRWPAGLPGGRDITEMVHFTDWLPTIAAITGAGVPTDRTIDGRNALPALRGDGELGDVTRFWQWNRYTPVVSTNAGMRHGPWKLVRPFMPEAFHVAPEDGEMDRQLKYEPEGITDIRRGPEPERTVPDPPPPLLFNLDDDPFEERDVAAEKPEVAERMLHQLENWFVEVECERATIEMD